MEKIDFDKTEKKEITSVYLPEHLKKKLMRLARLNRRSLSQQVTLYLEEKMQNNKISP